MHLRKMMLTALAAAFVWAIGSDAQASGKPRLTVGGHPYHNGNYFIPPSSAYEATRVFPPARYGMPSYYVPASYLPANMLVGPGYGYANPYGYYGYRPNPATWYPGVPQAKAGGYYLSGYGYYQTANW